MASRPTEGACEVAFAFHINSGSYGNVTLDGLNVAMIARTPGPMAEGNWSVAMYLDERANEQQRQALEAIFSGSAGGPLNELPTTPDDQDGEHGFTITHPFHPLFGQTFPLLSQQLVWGEERVFFADPQTQAVRSLPTAWTNLALSDPFLVVADGKAVVLATWDICS